MTTNRIPKFTTITIEDLPPFTGAVEFALDADVNLFIGANGTGKSTVLKLLAAEYPKRAIPGWKSEAYDIRVSNWPLTPQGRPDTKAVPQAYLPPVRNNMPISVNADTTRVFHPQPPDAWSTWDGLVTSSPWSFFDGSRVYHAMQKLYHEDLSSMRDRTRAAMVSYIAYQCVKDICPEILAGEFPKNIRTHEVLESRRASPTLPEELLSQPVEHYAMGIDTLEGEVDALYLGELSTGTQGVFLWIWFFALIMAYRHRFAQDWHKKEGIIFVDEIENHLHPSWQRRVIPALRKHFPNVQIFATTHSPFVVAGLRRGQIHKLYREDGVIKTPPLTDEEKAQEIVGWTVEEILREFMEIDDPTDEITANATATLRWLRYQPTASGDAESWRQEQIKLLQNAEYPSRDELSALRWLKSHAAVRGDAVQWRNDNMDELRAIVRREFEFGGPIAAQRELFLEQLDELLQEHDHADEDVEEERS